jgi:integrase
MTNAIQPTTSESPGRRSTVKRDDAPRGVFRRAPKLWAVRYVCGQGHTHEETIGALKGDAVRIHAGRRQQVHENPAWCPRAERRAKLETVAAQARAAAEAKRQTVTVREYAERWLLVHVVPECRERTALEYRSTLERHILPVFGDLSLGQVTRVQLREFLADKVGLSRGTQKNLIVPLRAMLNLAVDEGRILGNPAAGLFRQHRRGQTEQDARKGRALTAPELRLVLETAEAHAPDWADFLYTLAWTGLRLSEGCGLQWGDVDFAGQFLDVNRSAVYRARRVLVTAPKSGKCRRVDLPAVLLARLRARQSLREAEAVLAGAELSPWVFPAPTDPTKPVNGAFIRFKVWYRVLRRAGLRAVRLHDLRHTFATLLLEAGTPIAYVQGQLGHSSIQMTVDRYGHIRPGVNREAVNQLASQTAPGTPAPRNLGFTWVSGGAGVELKEEAV